MNLLSYLVPAIREVRAPLIGGYAWLLSVWMWFEGEVPEQSEQISTQWEALYRLNDVVGTVGVGAALSVAAYLVGSFIGEVIDVLTGKAFNINVERIEAVGQSLPDQRYRTERISGLLSEAQLRFQVSVPLATLALALKPLPGLILIALAVMLGCHALVLASRARLRWMGLRGEMAQLDTERKVGGRVDLRSDVAIMFNKGDELRILNRGPSTVRDLNLEEVGEDKTLVPGQLPIPELRSGDEVLLHLDRNLPRQSRIQLRATWVDGSGERMEIKTPVSLGQ